MRYQIRMNYSLNIIDYAELNTEKAVEHFSENGYEYLYVIKDGHLYDVISYHDFIDYGIEKRNRKYIVDKNNICSFTDLESFFLHNHDINRIAVVSDKCILFEINNIVEPVLIHSIEKNRYTIRFSDLCFNEIMELFSKYKRIFLVADRKTAEFFKRKFSGIAFEAVFDISFFENYSKMESELILDFLYGPKLIKKIFPDIQIFDYYKFIESVMMRKLIKYTSEKNVSLHLFKIADYSKLSSLSKYEQAVFENKQGMLEVLNNENILKKCCSGSENLYQIKNRLISDTIRQDDNMVFSQEDCDFSTLTVRDGIRRTIPDYINNNCTVHFFGPCTVMGIYNCDDETVPSLVSEKLHKEGIDVSVFNHGGLHGKNVLNSISGAVGTSLKSGDIVAVLDFLDDYYVNNITVTQTEKWFNNNKSIEEICFFDCTAHCSKRGNEILAAGICEEISHKITEKDHDSKEGNYFDFYNIKVDFDNYFCISNSAGVKFSKQLMTFQTADDHAALYVCYGIESAENLKKYISKAFYNCSKLFLFISLDHLNIKDQLEYLKLCSEYRSDDKITIINMEHFFNIYRKLFKDYDNYYCFIKKVVYCFDLAVNSLGIKMRFYKERSDDIRYSIYLFEVLRSCSENHILCKNIDLM